MLLLLVTSTHISKQNITPQSIAYITTQTKVLPIFINGNWSNHKLLSTTILCQSMFGGKATHTLHSHGSQFKCYKIAMYP